jgi:hypothetical protein
MKTKDDVINLFKRWYGDIADLHVRPKLMLLLRDNAAASESQEIMPYLQESPTKIEMPRSEDQSRLG